MESHFLSRNISFNQDETSSIAEYKNYLHLYVVRGMGHFVRCVLV